MWGQGDVGTGSCGDSVDVGVGLGWNRYLTCRRERVSARIANVEGDI